MSSSTSTILSNQPWWKEALVYQIYPSSFLAEDPQFPPNSKEATVGNIAGIISKVPYIASLGFDAIWLSPIFASPQNDMGYDISDYRSIHAPFGSVDDVQRLVDTLHATHISDGHNGKRKMRLLMDLVVNHTSNEHPWFLESASSTTNPKSDWYFWRDPKILSDGSHAEPNNWRSIFGGPAWHYVEARKQYYLALFLASQPDLNWENEEMRHATYADMRWWLDRGVDGFRIDSMNLMSKNPSLPDAAITEPDEKYQDGKAHYASGPRMHEFLQEIRREVFDHYGADEIFTVGEMGSVDTEESVAQYVAHSRRELNCVFHGMDLDFGPSGKYDNTSPFTVSRLRDITQRWQVAMPKFDAWNTVYLDNHDSGRSLSRYTSDAPEHRATAAKMLATYICTLSGTPFVLAGQEIGTANLGPTVGMDQYIDVEGQNHYANVLAHRRIATRKQDPDMSDVAQQLRLKSRDHGRLPMQWTSAPNAGFCAPELTPWMAVNPDHTTWNVESQLGVSDSVLEFWREIVAFRRRNPAVLVYGAFEMLDVHVTGEDVVGYIRTDTVTGRHMVVLLSFCPEERSVDGKDAAWDGWTVGVSNVAGADVRRTSGGGVVLGPYEAVVLCPPS